MYIITNITCTNPLIKKKLGKAVEIITLKGGYYKIAPNKHIELSDADYEGIVIKRSRIITSLVDVQWNRYIKVLVEHVEDTPQKAEDTTPGTTTEGTEDTTTVGTPEGTDGTSPVSTPEGTTDGTEDTTPVTTSEGTEGTTPVVTTEDTTPIVTTDGTTDTTPVVTTESAEGPKVQKLSDMPATPKVDGRRKGSKNV